MAGGARLVWLDQADAQNPALVGAKASRLARARARGLPVLDGFAVSVGVSDPVIGAGEAMLRSTDNSGAARTAVYNHPPPALLQDLAEEARNLGDSLVVRSSSRAEGESIWAGAFSSYLGMKPEELTQCVIGCWASVFNPNTLKRGVVTGTSPQEVGMAVLVQPEIRPTYGGVATVEENGAVKVIGTPGHPAGLVGGWERGHIAVVTRDDEVQADSSPLGSRLLRRIAVLSRATAEKIECNHIEWMADQNGKLHLVQAQPKLDWRLQRTETRAPDPAQNRGPWMRGVVRMMIRYPGPVGERHVWPWAIGLEDLSPAAIEQAPRPVATLIEDLQKGSAVLMSQRWGEPVTPTDIDRALSALRNGESSPLLDLISRHPEVDRSLAHGQLRNLEELGRALTASGVIPRPGWIWYLDPDNLDPAPSGQQGPIRRVGTTNWDAWTYGVITSQGETFAGIPAAGGWGVGRLRYIRNAEDAARFCPREVIVASHPVGNIAPLLWNAAGLVTEEGSPAAHLFEVAGWLGVPALCGVDVGQRISSGRHRSEGEKELIAAVDGHGGALMMLTPL
ncbi:MAG: PEP-utilizing enzyme [bacterium]|nr:PEP-utilizing enzyme [bacterium]